MKRAVILSLLVAGCAPSVEELRQEPVKFELTVPVSWDKVGACLVNGYADGWRPLYVPVVSEHRAELTIYFPGSYLTGDLPHAIFDIRGADRGTTVTFRRRKLAAGQVSTETKARELVERCGRD